MASTYSDKQLAFTEETSRFMSQRASQFDDNKIDRDGRIKQFLERRDPTRFGLKEEEEVAYRKHFQNDPGVLPLGRPRPGLDDKPPRENDEWDHSICYLNLSTMSITIAVLYYPQIELESQSLWCFRVLDRIIYTSMNSVNFSSNLELVVVTKLLGRGPKGMAKVLVTIP